MQVLVSPDMSKLNHALMKQETRRSNAAFSSKKIRKKRMDSSFLLTHHIARWMELQNIKRLRNQFISSTRNFSSVKIFIMQWRKNTELRLDKDG